MPKRPITAEDLLAITFVSDPQWEPNGDRILFGKKVTDREKNKYSSQLFTVTEGGVLKQWTSGPSSAGNGRWSPDGKQIAFIASRDEGPSQIFLIPTDGGEARALTTLPEGAIGWMEWSPLGNKLAILFRKLDECRTKKAAEKRKKKGLSDPPYELDSVIYRLDGDGYFGGDRFTVWVIDAQSGEASEVYAPNDVPYLSATWKSDGSGLWVTHNAAPKPWQDDSDDQIFSVSLGGKCEKLKGLPNGGKGGLSASPDGKWIAYSGSVDAGEAWGSENQRIYLASTSGGTPKCLSENIDICFDTSTLSDTRDFASALKLVWSKDSKTLYSHASEHGAQQVAKFDIASGKFERITKGQHLVGIGTLDPTGTRFAVTHGDTSAPDEIKILDMGGKLKALTHFNDELLSNLIIAQPEEQWVEAADGSKVHFWCLKPANAKGRNPAILSIHGGPHAQYGWAFFHEFQLMAAEGYVVCYSNPRGSKGYGEAHCTAIAGKWGDRDWVDIQAVLHWMQHQSFIHAGRIGVMGGSYGGYMTNWAVGHTNDFKAAISDRCVSNLISFGGNSDFPMHAKSYFGGAFYGPIENLVPLWNQSPMAFFDKVETPMLIIHSEGDLRCNIEQAEQVFSCLQVRGIESRFVRYPRNTSHGMSRSGPPDLRLHRLGEMCKWWKRHLA